MGGTSLIAYCVDEILWLIVLGKMGGCRFGYRSCAWNANVPESRVDRIGLLGGACRCSYQQREGLYRWKSLEIVMRATREIEKLCR